MLEIKNAIGKKTCCINPSERTIEIVQKGIKTLVRFNPDGSAEAINYRLDGTYEVLRFTSEPTVM